ncbi:MAG: recombinase family protein [Peptococcaceae bacterium]|nr:recombinase family protein [Peptococcaceae bacterium]
MTKHKEYGYVRVSSKDQNEDRQLIALREYGVAPELIFCDKQSGKDFDRPRYKLLMGLLAPKDLVVVKSIDRLGRNYEEILEQWRIITKIKEADILILDMPLLDTRSSRDLTGRLIADIVLQLMSYVAQTEREAIRTRQAEGIEAAKQRGVRFGPPRKQRPDDFDALAQAWIQGDITARKAAAKLDVSHSTFLRWVRNESSLCPAIPGLTRNPGDGTVDSGINPE